MTAIAIATARGRVAAAGRPGLVLHQARFELLAFLRDRRATFFTVAFPVLMLVLYGVVFGDATLDLDGHEVSWLTFWVPALMAFGIVGGAFLGVVVGVVRERETGILKRRRATPAPAWALVGGRAASLLAVSVGVALLVAAIGAAFYDVRPPAAALPGLLLTVAVGSLSLCGAGYAFSTLVGSIESAMPMTQVVVLPLYFISGVFVPTDALPGWLQGVGAAFPVEHLAGALHASFAPGAGAAPSWGDLLVLAAWGLAGALVAVRRFRWTPAGGTGA